MIFASYSFPEGPSKPLRSQEQEQEKEQEQGQKQEQEQKCRKYPLIHRQRSQEEKKQLPSTFVSPFIISIPVRAGEFCITQDMIENRQQLDADIDATQELKNIKRWNQANCQKRKTNETILQQINQWLIKINKNQTRYKKTKNPFYLSKYKIAMTG